MLKSLHIKGFKPWRDTGPVRFAPITAFFGTNSSGKTSLLQFLLMLKQTAESPDRQQILSLGGERSYVELGTFTDVFHRTPRAGAGEPVLAWRLDWGLEEVLEIGDPEAQGKTLFSGREIRFDATVRGADGSATVERMAYRFAGQKFGLARKAGDKKGRYNLEVSGGAYEPQRTRGRPWDLPAPVKCYGFPDQARTYFQNTGFLSDFVLAFEKLFDDINYLGPLRDFPKRQYTWPGGEPIDMGRRGEATVGALLAARGKGRYISPGYRRKKRGLEERVGSWLKELGLIDRFQVEEIAPGSNLYRVRVRKSPSSAEVLLTDIGFGVSQVLPVLVICYYVPEGSTILLEQPELHLHPSVQAGLADVFIDAVTNRGVQVILESHSEHLLKRLQRRIAEETFASEQAALYFCDRDNGASRLVPLDLDMFGNILNWPEDFFGDEFGEIDAMTRAVIERRKKAVAE